MLWLLPPLWVDWHVDHGFDPAHIGEWLRRLAAGGPVDRTSCDGGAPVAGEVSAEWAATALLGLSALAGIAILGSLPRAPRRSPRPLSRAGLALVFLLALVSAMAAPSLGATDLHDAWDCYRVTYWGFAYVVVLLSLFLARTATTTSLSDRSMTLRLGLESVLFVVLVQMASARGIGSWWLLGVDGRSHLVLVPAVLCLAVVAERAWVFGPRRSLLPLTGLGLWLLARFVSGVIDLAVLPDPADALHPLDWARADQLAGLAAWADALGLLPWLVWSYAACGSLRDPQDRAGARASLRVLSPVVPVLVLLTSPALLPDPRLFATADRAYREVDGLQLIELPDEVGAHVTWWPVEVAVVTVDGRITRFTAQAAPSRHVIVMLDRRVSRDTLLAALASFDGPTLSLGWATGGSDEHLAAARWPYLAYRLAAPRFASAVIVRTTEDLAERSSGAACIQLAEDATVESLLTELATAGTPCLDVRNHTPRPIEARHAVDPWTRDLVPFGAPWWAMGAVLGALLGLARWPRRRTPRLRPASPYRAPALRAPRLRPEVTISTRVLRRGLVTAGRLALLALACGALGTLIGWLVLAPFGARP